jgi:hypothetical protein
MMTKIEEILPKIRKGSKARRKVWPSGVFHISSYLSSYPGLTHEDILADDWELVPEPIRVADYLVPVPFLKDAGIYAKDTHPIGQQPEGAVLVPGSEREQE